MARKKMKDLVMKNVRIVVALFSFLTAVNASQAAFPLDEARPGISGGTARDLLDEFYLKLHEGGGNQLAVLRMYATGRDPISRLMITALRRDADLVKGLTDGLRAKAKAAREAKRHAEAGTYEAAATGLERQVKDSALIVAARADVARAVELLDKEAAEVAP